MSFHVSQSEDIFNLMNVDVGGDFFSPHPAIISFEDILFKDIQAESQSLRTLDEAEVLLPTFDIEHPQFTELSPTDAFLATTEVPASTESIESVLEDAPTSESVVTLEVFPVGYNEDPPNEKSPLLSEANVNNRPKKRYLKSSSEIITDEPPKKKRNVEVPPEETPQDPPKKRRGRKPLPLHERKPRKPRQRPKKTKLYEREQPFEDEVAEKRRQNAILAKIHREKQREAKTLLQKELDVVKLERDKYKKEVEMLREKNNKLLKQLEDFKQRAAALQKVLNE